MGGISLGVGCCEGGCFTDEVYSLKERIKNKSNFFKSWRKGTFAGGAS